VKKGMSREEKGEKRRNKYSEKDFEKKVIRNKSRAP